jgi:lipoprotein-anchoring transpeptidase ErfK/SrfK
LTASAKSLFKQICDIQIQDGKPISTSTRPPDTIAKGFVDCARYKQEQITGFQCLFAAIPLWQRPGAFQLGHAMINRSMTVHSAEAIRRCRPSAIVTLAAAAALAALTANAAARQAPSARPTEAAAPREAGEPLMAIVSLKSQHVTIYDAKGWILRAPVSSGTTGRETPAGIFSVLEKDKDHHSNLYDDAWMPNMLRITWSGIALHGGPLPGYAASHGCVRMPYGFAEKLFDKVPVGMRVIISPDDAEPVEFSNPALFVPKPEAIAAAPVRAEALGREADEATKTALEAKSAAAAAAREAAPLMASLRKLKGLKTQADAALALAEKVLAAAKTDQAKARAEEQRQKAAAKVAELATQLDAAEANAKSKLDAAAAAEAVAKAAETRRADAAKAANEAKLALAPVSVFISRATQKLYVRRPTHKRAPEAGEMFDTTLEVPVTIRNPEKPIGTHVFTAVARSDRGLRWTAVTIDSGDSAQDALERISIPQDVLDRIAPTALPRSSIIISDEPLHRETNYRTEFVVALHNQPQGGLAMRRAPTEMRVARGNYGADNGFTRWFGGQFYDQRQGSQNYNQRQGSQYYDQRQASQYSNQRQGSQNYNQRQGSQYNNQRQGSQNSNQPRQGWFW